MSKEQKRPEDDKDAKREQAGRQADATDMDRRRLEDPLFIEHTKAEDPSGRPGQATRDNVNPNIPSANKERLIDECGRVDPNPGGIVDPNSLGMPGGGVAPKAPPTPDELRTQRDGEAEGTVLPRAGSINEPPGSNVLGKTEEDIPPEILAKGKPVISGLEPAEAVSGEPDFTLVISGDNFYPGSVIVFGDNDEPTTMDGDTLSTIVKPSLFAAATVPVKVRNGSLVSDPVDFTFTGPVADDQDALEDEIDDAIDEGDATVRKPKNRRR